MSATRFVRHFTMAAMAAGILALSATEAQATHFRYGTIKWRVTDPTPDPTPTTLDLEVTAECAWRRSFYSPPPNPGTAQNTGQILRVLGTGVSLQTALIVDVSAVNLTEDWFVGARTFQFNNIPRTALPLRVFWNGNARISTLLDGNADDFFNVEARVSTDQSNVFSPVSSLLPIINVAHGQPAAHFFIPASDPEGDALTWTISSTARSSLTKAAPDGADDIPPATLSINSTTGEVTWDTASELTPGPGTELYAVQFLVTDSKGGEAPVDALLRIVPNTSQPPVALINDSPNAATFDVNPGSPISFVFKGTDPDATDVISLASGSLPPGSSFTPNLPFSGTQPQSATFNWTPTLADVGSHVISVSVTDPFTLQDTNSATITVLPNFQPDVTCPGSVSLEATGATTSHTAQATVDDPEGQALTVRWLVDGNLEQTDNVPAGPDPTTLDFTFAYSLGAHALRVEVSDGITNTVVCEATVTIVDTTAPVIALPASQLLEATGPGGAVALWSPDPPLANDLVDGPVPVTCSHSSGNTFPILPPPPQNTTTTVTCTATDSSNNTATGTFDIIVEDTTPPAITNVPADITVFSTEPGGGAFVTYTSPDGFDIVDLTVPVNCVPPSGSLFPVGTTPVLCTASDVHGNSSSASFTVTVKNPPPAPCLTLSPTELWPPNHKMRDIQVEVELMGGGVPNTVCVISSVTSSEPVTGNTYGRFAPDWMFTDLDLQLRAERYDKVGRTYTVTVTCTDPSGQVGTATATVKVPHDQRPHDVPPPLCTVAGVTQAKGAR